MRSRFLFSLSIFCLVAAGSSLRAQMGNDNPTGPAGVFNGNVTTGCSYDPYTGNATRSITDLVVTGTLGSYPLALTRTANSRHGLPTAFGSEGAGSTPTIGPSMNRTSSRALTPAPPATRSIFRTDER